MNTGSRALVDVGRSLATVLDPEAVLEWLLEVVQAAVAAPDGALTPRGTTTTGH